MELLVTKLPQQQGTNSIHLGLCLLLRMQLGTMHLRCDWGDFFIEGECQAIEYHHFFRPAAQFYHRMRSSIPCRFLSCDT